MRRLLPFLLWFWGSVVCTVILGAAINRGFGLPREEVVTFLHAHWRVISLACLVLGGLTLWAWIDRARQERADRARQLRHYFALCKPAAALRPEDLGFRVLKLGEIADTGARPHYEVYIPPKAVPYAQMSATDHHQVYDAAGLVHALQQGNKGRGFILVGQPLAGKTRALYETLRQLPHYDVVRPDGQRPTPPDDAFALLKDCQIVLLVDDLNSYAGGILDLLAFHTKIDQYAADWAIVATCRDGAQLSVVTHAHGTSLRRFYEELPLKLGLLPLTADGKARLAQAIGKTWDPKAADLFPTPGFITMREALEAMRERFRSDLDPEHKATLRSLKLLATAGILPYTHARLQAIMAQLFHRTVHLEDVLERLAGEDFIQRPGWQDPVQPEPAYLQGVVTYREGTTPEDDFPQLGKVLERIGDVEGLLYLGYTYLVSLKQAQASFDVYERVLVLRPENPHAWFGKGVTLWQLGRFEEALVACERALTLRPDDPDTWYGKGVTLWQLGRCEEALVAYERALALRPNDPGIWHNKGIVLRKLGRFEEALAAYERALTLRPNDPGIWHNKGIVLRKLGRFEEALAAYERALTLRPDDPGIWYGKGNVLDDLGRFEEALAAYEEALTLRPDDPDTWYGKGIVLRELGRFEEALAAYEEALTLRPDDPDTWYGKGVTLWQLGRFEEALAAYEEALTLRPDDPSPWWGKGNVLDDLGRREEALVAYEEALTLQPDDPGIWHNKGNVLDDLGRREEALAAYERALALRPEAPGTWDGKGNVLTELGRFEEALAAYERALALRPEAPGTWDNKGNVLTELGRFEEALAAYEEALTLRPEAPGTWYGKGIALNDLRWFEEALVAYERALALRPDDPDTWHNKGVVLRELGRREEALAAYERALIYFNDVIALHQQQIESERHWKLVYNLARALMDKGRTLTQLQKWQDAAACYNEGIGWWERLVNAGMAHLTPTLLKGLERRFALHRQLTAWDGAARDVMQALTYATPLLRAPAPSRHLRETFARFRRQLQALSDNELVQLYDALGNQAIRAQEGIALPPDPRKIILPSTPHPGANPDRAMEINKQYQRALAEWQALSWWQRRKIKKPTRPSGI